MSEQNYYEQLYQIARQLNQEFSLHAVLKSALEKTVQLLGLQTGWIWLVQEDSKSVYLAASYQLPPALANHPERLSGWCYCIKVYFANALESASNVSEITCTRLKDIDSGTLDLKFHASIPISIQGQKIGLLNLLTEESQQLNKEELTVLNTISELIAMAVQRSRNQQKAVGQPSHSSSHQIMERVVSPKLASLDAQLQQAIQHLTAQQPTNALHRVEDAKLEVEHIQQQLQFMLAESQEKPPLSPEEEADSLYPFSPLSNRELEVIELVQKGHTNKQIADFLFISERTVKFHISSILSKLQAKTRTEAVNIAIQRGLIGFS